MKHNVIRYSMIVLLIGLIALGAGRANAQERHRNEIIIESLSWGLSSGQTARISLVNLADGSVRSRDPILARIQLLDTEGEVIAQSDEIRVESGKIRFWDASYEQIGGVREPGTGRIQLRARILFEEGSSDRDRPLYNPFITVEVVDSATGITASITNSFSTATFRP